MSSHKWKKLKRSLIVGSGQAYNWTPVSVVASLPVFIILATKSGSLYPLWKVISCSGSTYFKGIHWHEYWCHVLIELFHLFLNIWRIYIGYSKSKFWWSIKKKASIYFQTIYIAIWCTYLTLLFWHSFHHCWGICHSGPPVFVSCIVEWFHLWWKPRVNGLFDLVIVEPLATK
jgi:hypothetical protein